MIPKFRKKIVLAVMILGMGFTMPVMSAAINSESKPSIKYSRSPTTTVVSFREITPEFADQDQTPLVRIYGDGRVVVFHPTYMKQAGQYEMMMSPVELEDLLIQLSSTLISFEENDVRAKMKTGDDLLLASASEQNPIILFHDSDAEISVFEVNIDSYQPEGRNSRVFSSPDLNRSWRGLRFDARDHTGIAALQDLMRSEMALRSLTKRNELIKVN